MEYRMSLRQWQKSFLAGEFDANDFETQVKAGWYDCWCEEEELGWRMRKMANILVEIKDGGKVDLDKTYVFFKQGCPASDDPIYDVFKICDLETGDVLFCVDCGDKRAHAYYDVYGYENAFDVAALETNSESGLIRWFNTPAPASAE